MYVVFMCLIQYSNTCFQFGVWRGLRASSNVNEYIDFLEGWSLTENL